MKLSVIFEDKPDRWGYRGDPYFWDYLGKKAENMDLMSPEELENWIKKEHLDLSGVAGIEGKMERQIPVNKSNPLNARIHKYYLLEQDVWICNRGNLRFVSDWTPQEVWALACEDTLDDDGNLVDRRDLGFFIIHSDRSKGIVV